MLVESDLERPGIDQLEIGGLRDGHDSIKSWPTCGLRRVAKIGVAGQSWNFFVDLHGSECSWSA